MSQFDHCIALAEIDGKRLWLDPTYETCPYGELPGNDQESDTLVFFQEGARFLKTPLLSPQRNKTLTEMQVGIDTAGGATVRAKTTYTGREGLWNRYHYKLYSPEERTREVEDEIFRSFPGAVLKTCTFSPLDDLNVPLTIDVEFSVPEYAKIAGTLLLIPLPTYFYSVESVGNETRTHPLVWNVTESIQTHVTIQIPEGYRLRYVPENYEINLPFAFYRHEYTSETGTIHFLALKERQTCKVNLDQYSDYKRFEENVARETDTLIILEMMGTPIGPYLTSKYPPK
jgi:hypothetical protein